MLPFIQKEPAAVSAAVVSVVSLLVLFNVIQVTEAQFAGINIALVTVLGLFVRQSSTPTAAPKLEQNTVVDVTDAKGHTIGQSPVIPGMFVSPDGSVGVPVDDPTLPPMP